MNRDICGIGRCKAVPDMTVWSVPICQEHWEQCCKEMPGSSSLFWLHKKAKAEFRSSMPKDDSGLKVTPSQPMPTPKLKTAPVPAKNPPPLVQKPKLKVPRVVKKPVRISPPPPAAPKLPRRIVKKPIRISKP